MLPCTVYPGHVSDLERFFGQEYSQLSSLFGWATDHVFSHHGDHVMDYLEFWAPCLPRFAAAIFRRGEHMIVVFLTTHRLDEGGGSGGGGRMLRVTVVRLYLIGLCRFQHTSSR